MKIRFKALLVFLLPFVLTLTYCGKYEEGPSFSLRGKTNRVVNTWKIDKLFVDDNDITALSATYVNSYKIEFKKDERVEESFFSEQGSHKNFGTWTFEDSYKYLVTKFSGTITKYRILRLTAGEMWLENYVNDVKHERRFESKD